MLVLPDWFAFVIRQLHSRTLLPSIPFLSCRPYISRSCDRQRVREYMRVRDGRDLYCGPYLQYLCPYPVRLTWPDRGLRVVLPFSSLGIQVPYGRVKSPSTSDVESDPCLGIMSGRWPTHLYVGLNADPIRNCRYPIFGYHSIPHAFDSF